MKSHCVIQDPVSQETVAYLTNIFAKVSELETWGGDLANLCSGVMGLLQQADMSLARVIKLATSSFPGQTSTPKPAETPAETPAAPSTTPRFMNADIVWLIGKYVISLGDWIMLSQL
ncbi:hypothetical protein BGZ65_005167 [Modicella reniformis]|uniref:Uncharacterized protein n=1 Tax=Modicella reniformis TaxID=1440133 RepID=A0A9P6J0V0_9FUNG|nr:hypothetical protein BGZ65_005167 [Modicella reniformis]